MTQARILLASPNHWDSPFQVGSHHLARRFIQAGWKAAYISDPISPLHLAHGWTKDLALRWGIHRSGGSLSRGGNLWTYVPTALLTPHAYPLLRSECVHRRWHRWTVPDVVAQACRRGFGKVDLLYIDSVHQSFWLDVLDYHQAVYRIADYNPSHLKYTSATRVLEREMARRVDLVIYPSMELKDYAAELGARRSLYLPNGVDYAHFAQDTSPPPPEYRQMRGPIAVYVGVMPKWIHFDWLREAALRLPEMSFVFIGPKKWARPALGNLANVHLLGCRDYARIPSYLRHANVGLLPFDVVRDPRAVNALNPQKLYAYMASGLPVVASSWDSIRDLGSPARVCSTLQQFITALREAVAEPGAAVEHRRYASAFDWGSRVEILTQALASITSTDPAIERPTFAEAV